MSSVGARVVGPVQVWWGTSEPPRPWPQILYNDRIGWFLRLRGVVVGAQWIGFTR